MRKMKNLVVLVSFCILMILISGCVYATYTYKLDFKVTNNTVNEDFNLYILLPKEYVEFAIDNSYLNIKYNGANTLKENTIPGIDINKSDVQSEVYIEKQVEYVQILLNKDETGSYKFNILEDYSKMNFKYRITNEEKDYIIHIDNFEIDDGICEMEYDYETDKIRQPDKVVVPTSAMILIIILVFVIVIGTIAYVKQR